MPSITKPGSSIKTQPKSAKGTKTGRPITPIIGAPMIPYLEATSNMQRNAMPIINIVPCTPHIAEGLTLFTLTGQMAQYKSKLRELGYELGTGNTVKICFQGDVTPSEAFSNDYGESFLAKMTNMASEGISDLNQITGSKTGTESAKKLANALSGAAKDTMFEKAGDYLKAKSENLDKWAKSNAGKMGGTAGMINAMLGGARIDFPQVWKNSAFSSSYSITVKLYNPSPGNIKATEYFIIGPLTALLLLGLPSQQNEDNRAYNYPYFHKIYSEGLFNIHQGAITSIQVSKGGEGSIGLNQRLGLVEVRMDFANLHAHMIGSSSSKSPIPTLMSYVESLRKQLILKPVYIKTPTTEDLKSQKIPAAGESVAQPGPQPSTTTSPTERVDQGASGASDSLETLNPKDLSTQPTITYSSLTPVAPPTVSQMPTSVQDAQTIKADTSKAKSTAMNLRLLQDRANQVAKLRGG